MLNKLSFEDLILWQNAHGIVLKTYQFTARLPKEEAAGLKDELRSGSRAIASHIAEGHQANNPGRRMQHLCSAHEALKRTSYLVLLCADLSFGSDQFLQEQLRELEKLLLDFMKLTRNNLTLNFTEAS